MQQLLIDRARAARLMEKAGMDVLVLTEPETFKWATGTPIGVAGLFRRPGAGFAIIPADPELPVAAVVADYNAPEFARLSPVTEFRSFPIWIETIDVSASLDSAPSLAAAMGKLWARTRDKLDFQRPATFDIRQSAAQLKEILLHHGLGKARIGLELDFIGCNDLARLRDTLGEAQLVDGTAVLQDLMAIKTASEIEKLRLGINLTEAGLRHAFENIEIGQTVAELRSAFRQGVRSEADRRGIAGPIESWEYISIGTHPRDPGVRVGAGSIIKADVGCVIDGYSADCSRNFVFGEASRHQRELHAALEAAFDAGLALLKPGHRLYEVHQAAQSTMHRLGFEYYSRGHFGHGLGSSVFSEQWPFIAADSQVPIEADMVLAYEIPIEIIGIGAFNLEDQMLITANGAESMNSLPRKLLQVGGGRKLDKPHSA